MSLPTNLSLPNNPPDTTPLHRSHLHIFPFDLFPTSTTSPTPVIYSAPSLDSVIISAAPSTIFLESFSLTNGFYRLAAPQGFLPAQSMDFDFEPSEVGWRIPVVVDSPISFRSPLYIPDATAKPSAITWWALQMELMVSAFIFHPSAILDTTLLGWVGRDPSAKRRAYYFALRYFSSYFTHLGRAFIPAADILFADLCDLFGAEGSYIFTPVPRDHFTLWRPTASSPSCPTLAQYLPVDVPISRGGPFAYAQHLPMAFRMARRQIFRIPVFVSTLVTPKPFPPLFHSSFLMLKRHVLRHVYIVRSLWCFMPSRIAQHLPRTQIPAMLPPLTTPPTGVRSQGHFFSYSTSARSPSCRASSRTVHYPHPWTLIPFAFSPLTKSPRCVRFQRPFSTSPHVVLIPPLFTMHASQFAAFLVILRHLFQHYAALSLISLYAPTFHFSPLHIPSPRCRSHPSLCNRDYDKYPP